MSCNYPKQDSLNAKFDGCPEKTVVGISENGLYHRIIPFKLQNRSGQIVHIRE